MNRTQVDSTMLESVGYDPVSSVLELEFTSGGVYQYAEVSEETWRELMEAESKGHYFREYIEDQYHYLQVVSPTRRFRRRRRR